MEIKLKKIVTANGALNKLMSKEVPIKVGFQLSKIAKKLNEELSIYNDNRVKLIKKYGEEDKKKNGNYNIKKENIETFQKELTELMEVKVKVDIDKIKIKEIENVKLSGGDLLALDFLLEE